MEYSAQAPHTSSSGYLAAGIRPGLRCAAASPYAAKPALDSNLETGSASWGAGQLKSTELLFSCQLGKLESRLS